MKYLHKLELKDFMKLFFFKKNNMITTDKHIKQNGAVSILSGTSRGWVVDKHLDRKFKMGEIRRSGRMR